MSSLRHSRTSAIFWVCRMPYCWSAFSGALSTCRLDVMVNGGPSEDEPACRYRPTHARPTDNPKECMAGSVWQPTKTTETHFCSFCRHEVCMCNAQYCRLGPASLVPGSRVNKIALAGATPTLWVTRRLLVKTQPVEVCKNICRLLRQFG